jgi:two-component system OmpR family sensor kinase
LLILLDNARTHTPPEAAIHVTSEVNAGYLLIHVRDTGAGIAPQALSHIFERFYREDAARTGSGAGLGLAIAKELIEAQDGALTVDSRVGQGSVFTVKLPQATR